MKLIRLVYVLSLVSIAHSQVINKNFGAQKDVEDDKEFVDLKEGLEKQQDHIKQEAQKEALPDAGDTPVDSDAPVELPESLTIKNFDRTLSKGIHFVEFFSPYCAHCRALEPIWEDLYKTYQGEGARDGIFLNQVDCVANGDLCSRESITYYPNLRLYVPNDKGNGGKLVSTYPTGDDKTVKAFTQFLREQVSETKDTAFNSAPKSTLLTPSEMVGAIAGNLGQPILVSFWPTDNKELNDDNFMESKVDGCSNCDTFRTVWSKVTNQIDLKSGYFNCRSNPKICKSLGLENLAKTTDRYHPVVYMFLPTDQGGNKIRYKAANKAKTITQWAKRLSEIYQVKEVTVNSLKDKMHLATRLQQTPSTQLGVESKVTFVYLYDKDSYVSEDELIFGQLIQPVMDMKSEVYLYKSSDQKFKTLLERQQRNLLDYIHHNKSEPAPVFNEPRFVSETASSLPTWLCFKDNSLIAHVFPSRSARDVREYGKVFNFIKANSLPLVEELNDATYRSIFTDYPPNSGGIFTEDEKVVVSFVDSNDFAGVFDIIGRSSLLAHDYHHLRQELLFKHLEAERENKRVKAKKVRDDGGDSVEFRHTLNRKLPVFTDGKTTIVYFDLAKNANALERWGWKRIAKRDLKPGDSVIISRFGNKKFFWDKDVYGGDLKLSELSALRDTLATINFDRKLFKPATAFRVPKRTLLSSPYSSSFQFLDILHTHGLKGYLPTTLIVVFFFVALLHVRRRRRLSRSQKLKGLGILGMIPTPPNSNDRPGKYD